MKEITITVPIYHTFVKKTKKDKTIMVGMNWYRTAHYRSSNTVKKAYLKIVENELEKHLYPVFEGAVEVDYKVYMKRKGSDGGNVRSVIEKFVLDALVKNYTISEDNFQTVIGGSTRYYLDKENPRCEITIRVPSSDIVIIGNDEGEQGVYIEGRLIKVIIGDGNSSLELLKLAEKYNFSSADIRFANISEDYNEFPYDKLSDYSEKFN